MTKILVVDDSELDRRLVGGLLERLGGVKLRYAEDGKKALERMQEEVPDLVLTDLQMPEQDGLQLVNAISLQYPQVPVILMTAHGSETLAVEALQQGAASYVPKSQLANKLTSTVQDVLALARADRTYEKLIGCLDRTEFDFRLDNDPRLIDPLVDLIQQIVSGMELCEPPGRFQVGGALKEALLNALYRGNLEISFTQLSDVRQNRLADGQAELIEQRRSQSPYCERQVFVSLRILRDEAHFVVRDDGPGFDALAVPVPGNLASLEPQSGRGLVLMRAFMDEVRHNATGNEVTLIKRRPERASQQEHRQA